MRNTFRTLEVVYWLMSLVIGVALTLLAPSIASFWIKTSILDEEALTAVIINMAWVVALRWPIGVYQGALMGLQQHVKLNLLQVGLSLLSCAGAVLILAWIDNTIISYFYWQLIAVSIGVLGFMVPTWQGMPKHSSSARFNLSILKNLYQFAAGVGGNAILGTILRQADKIILSGMLPMKQFAYYSLASLLARIVSMVADVVSNAAFPKLSQMLGADKPKKQIVNLYHLSSQLVAVLIIPFSVGLAFFSYEAVLVFTGDENVASQTANILSILVIAKMLHASMIVPYALQLAYGWVKLSILINIASVIWLIPALYLLVDIYGVIGAASAWFAVTLGYVFIGTPFMHRKLLPGEGGQWFHHSLIMPLIVVTIFYSLMKQLQFSEDRWLLAFELILMGCVAIILTVSITPLIRQKILLNIKWIQR